MQNKPTLVAVAVAAAALALSSSASANRIVLWASPKPTFCTAYLSGHAAQVTFSSRNLKVGPECSAWQRSYAAAGEYWVRGADPAQPPDIRTVCILGSGRVSAVVADDGGDFYGDSACANLLAAGWKQRALW